MARLGAKRRGKIGSGTLLLAIVSIAAPLLVFIAALGTRSGLLDYPVGHDLLAMRVAPALAVLGAVAAAVLLFKALRGRAPVLLAVLALAVPAATLGGFVWQAGRIADGPPDDISTDLAEVPGFGDLRGARNGRTPAAIGGVEVCPGAQPAMTQVAPETAVWALQQAGFSLQGGVSVGRAAGVHRGFWFGVGHDAVIRIRPGRTDIRVAARDGRPHGGEACRLATRISEALRTGE